MHAVPTYLDAYTFGEWLNSIQPSRKLPGLLDRRIDAACSVAVEMDDGCTLLKR